MCRNCCEVRIYEASLYGRNSARARKLVKSCLFSRISYMMVVFGGALVALRTYDSMKSSILIQLLEWVVIGLLVAECLVQIVADHRGPWLYLALTTFEMSAICVLNEWWLATGLLLATAVAASLISISATADRSHERRDLRGWSWDDNSAWVALDISCTVLMSSKAALPIDIFPVAVLRMLRLMKVEAILSSRKLTPHMRLVERGMFDSLPTLGWLVAVLLVALFLFALQGMYLFQSNDPAHFGSPQLAMLTLFEVFTLQDWTAVMYTNLYGCDKFIGYTAYYTWNNTNVNYSSSFNYSRSEQLAGSFKSDFGGSTFYRPICSSPVANEIASPVYFVLVVIVALVVRGVAVAVIVQVMYEAFQGLDQRRLGQSGNSDADANANDHNLDTNRLFDSIEGDTDTDVEAEDLDEVSPAKAAASAAAQLEELYWYKYLHSSEFRAQRRNRRQPQQDVVAIRKRSTGDPDSESGPSYLHPQPQDLPVFLQLMGDKQLLRWQKKQQKLIKRSSSKHQRKQIQLSNSNGNGNSNSNSTLSSMNSGMGVLQRKRWSRRCSIKGALDSRIMRVWSCFSVCGASALAVLVLTLDFTNDPAGGSGGSSGFSGSLGLGGESFQLMPTISTNDLNYLWLASLVIWLLWFFEASARVWMVCSRERHHYNLHTIALPSVLRNLGLPRHTQSAGVIVDFCLLLTSAWPLWAGWKLGPMLLSLRLLRLLSLLNIEGVDTLPLVLRQLLHAIVNAMAVIRYQILIMIFFLYGSAVAAHTLFSTNDPSHFGSLHRAMLSLFATLTLDNWTPLLHTQMLGCQNFNPVDGAGGGMALSSVADTVMRGTVQVKVAAAGQLKAHLQGLPLQRVQYSPCVDGQGYGYGWVAAVFFVVFVSVGTFLILQLVVGATCTMLQQYLEWQKAWSRLDQQVALVLAKPAMALALQRTRDTYASYAAEPKPPILTSNSTPSAIVIATTNKPNSVAKTSVSTSDSDEESDSSTSSSSSSSASKLEAGAAELAKP